MAVIHNARHTFNNGVTNIPSTSVLNALDAMDPREWKIHFQTFSSLTPVAAIELVAADVPVIDGYLWDAVQATAGDCEGSFTSQAESGGTLTLTNEGSADDSSLLQMEGGNFYAEVGFPWVFETRCVPTVTTTSSLFIGMGAPTLTIDVVLDAGGAAFSPVTFIGCYATDSTGTTLHGVTSTATVNTDMGTGTIVTGTAFTFSCVYDGALARAYLNGVLLGSTSNFPTARLNPQLGMESGGAACAMEMDYILWANKTPRGGARP